MNYKQNKPVEGFDPRNTGTAVSNVKGAAARATHAALNKLPLHKNLTNAETGQVCGGTPSPHGSVVLGARSDDGTDAVSMAGRPVPRGDSACGGVAKANDPRAFSKNPGTKPGR